MKHDETRRFCALIGVLGITTLALLILFLSMAPVASAQSSQLMITETQISHNGTASGAAIYGNKILWIDWRNGQDNTDVYMYDLSTSQETQISHSGVAGGSPPSIYGNNIVWCDWPKDNNPNIRLYDLSTSQETQITHSGETIQPMIYNNRIVWEEYLNNKRDIYMYDLSTSQKTQISHNESAYNPAIYDNKIVWDWNPIGTAEIYMYDLSTSKETQISHSGTAAVPEIYSSRVVWLDYRNGWDKPDIYMYDLSTSKESQVSHSGCAGNPAIYDNRIVWTDTRNGENNGDIYMYDISTSQETQITTNESQQDSPAIYGDMIVWTDWRNGNPDIYMGTLSEEEEPTPLPDAAFSATPTSGNAPLKVKFTSTSTGSPTEWKWSFGDGSALVTDQNPEYTYSKAGVYTVKHTAINAYGRSTEIKTNYITVGSVSPNADFSASTTSGNAPLTVKFTDKSTGSPTEWKWSLGDGSALVTQYNPTYIYTKPGTYTVKETVSSAAGKDTEIKTNYITVTAPLKAPVAAMSASPTSGNAPLKVQFTDKSTNYPTSWKWSFGDGTYSTDQNPAHTYTKAGKYTIVLTVKNAKGSNTVTKSSYINVAAPLKAPVTAFSAIPVSGNTPLKVQFTDSSTGSPTSWKWDFGDKSSSTEKNPAHTYSAAGTYTVKLTATNAAGSNTVTKTSYITVKVASTSSNVYISGLRLGASGETPNQEYVQITNKGTTDAKMNGWKITDSGSIHTYNFLSSYTLKAKTTVTLYTGKGTNTATKLFWGKGVYVWNNEGDTAYLYNAQGTLVSKLTK